MATLLAASPARLYVSWLLLHVFPGAGEQSVLLWYVLFYAALSGVAIRPLAARVVK